MGKDIILTEDNITEWKQQLSSRMKERFNLDFDYDEIKEDSDWIEDYKGCTVEEPISDEIENWD